MAEQTSTSNSKSVLQRAKEDGRRTLVMNHQLKEERKTHSLAVWRRAAEPRGWEVSGDAHTQRISEKLKNSANQLISYIEENNHDTDIVSCVFL